MKKREFFEKLEETRKENKKNIERGKSEAKSILENANNCFIVATDRGCGICGNGLDLMATISSVLSAILEQTPLTKKDLNDLVDIADKVSSKKGNDILELKDLLNDLKNMMKKVEKL